MPAIQQYVLGTAFDFDQIESIVPAQLAEALPEPQLREQLARALCLQVMIPDAPDARELKMAERFIRALGGSEDALASMRLAYEQNTILLRLDAARSSFLFDGAR